MGECFVQFYKEKVKSTWKLAFFTAFVLGLLIHLYKLTNLLPVSDSLINYYSNQNMVSSGRWFLAIACGISSFFDLPWITGLLSLVYISLTAALVTDVFDMKNPCLIMVSSGLLVSFPSVYATLGFSFTADGYMMAMLLAALSVQLTKIPTEPQNRKTYSIRIALGALCVCLSCGIYQAYISFAFILAVCYFITRLFDNRNTTQELIYWIVAQVILYIAALVANFVIWKLCLYFEGFSANSYQGIDQVGHGSQRGLFETLYWIFLSFIQFLLEWNVLENGLTSWSTLNILIIGAFIIGIIVACVRSGCVKRWLHIVLLVLCLVSLPIGCCVLMLSSDGVFYHALMMQSVCVLFVFTGVIWERWCKPKNSTVVFVLLCAIVFNNSLMANIYYYHLDQSFKRTQALTSEINTRIHLMDDGTIKYVAILGSLDGWGMEDFLNDPQLRGIGPWKTMSYTLLSEHFLDLYTDFDLAYYRTNGLEYPLVDFFETTENLYPEDWKYRFPKLSDSEENAIAQLPEVQEMPIWPSVGSMKQIGDTLVIKLSDS